MKLFSPIFDNLFVKYIRLSFSIIFILLIISGCDSSDNNQSSGFNGIFKLTDNNYYSGDFLVMIHDASSPTESALAAVIVQQGGTISFRQDSIFGDLADDSIQVEFSNNLSELTGSMIITTGDLREDGSIYLASNWYIEQGTEWNQLGDSFNETDITVDVNYIFPSHSSNNYKLCGDIGNYYWFWDYNSNDGISNDTKRHYVRSLNDAGQLNLGATITLDDNTAYAAYKENVDWTSDTVLTLDNFNEIDNGASILGFESVENIYYMDFYKNSLNLNYNSYDERVYFLTGHKRYYNSSIDSLNEQVQLSQAPYPFANGSSGIVRWRLDTDLSEGYYSAYHENLNHQSGDSYEYPGHDISGNYNSSTGSIFDFNHTGNADNCRLSYSMSPGDYYYNEITWDHYFDPDSMSRFDLPLLDPIFEDLTLTSGPSATLYDWDGFEGAKDLLQAVFQNHNYSNSFTERKWTYITPFSWSNMATNSLNNKLRELSKQKLDYFYTRRFDVPPIEFEFQLDNK